MKRTITTLSCALLLMGAARAQAKDLPRLASATQPMTASSDAGYVGENTGYVGDFDETELYDGSGGVVGEAASAAHNVGSQTYADAAPLSATHSHALPISQSLSRGYGSSANCDSNFGSFGRTSRSCDDHWLRAETLLWFTQDRETPPLVTTGPGLENQFGDPIDSGLAPGYRLDYGHYFADGRVGLGARVWGLYGESEDYSVATTNPADNIQRPFYNTFNDMNDALIVAGTFGPNQFDGGFSAESDLDIIATEVYGRLLFGRSQDYRVDMIGGYSYFGIDDDLTLRSSSRTVAGGNIGEVRSFTDSFRTENRFYGGQLGFETMLEKGRWSLTSLTKVHLGNMNQRVRISGQAVDQIIGLPPITANKGFFAQDQQGSHERDEFTFIPEVNFKLGYEIRQNVQLTVGYSFLYWSSVAMAGNQLDPNISGPELVDFTFVPAPTDYNIQEDGFWIQGIDLGMNITF